MPHTVQRQHPIAIWQYAYRYLFFLLFPLLRGAQHIEPSAGLLARMSGSPLTVAAILLPVILPPIAWRRHTFALTEEGFIIRRGVFLRRTTLIPRRHIATLAVEQPFLLRPLRAVRLSIDTDAGGGRRVDFRLTLYAEQAANILEQQPTEAHLPRKIFRAKVSRMFLLSALSSNSLSGILLLALTFQRAGVLLGQGFQNKVLGNLEAAADAVKVIPRTAALLAMALVAGWLAAAAGNLIRHAPFRAIRCDANLTLRVGCVTRREYVCRVDAIHYADIRQTLVSRLLRLRTVFIHCVGYGKAKNTLSVLIPFCRESTAEKELRRLLPDYRTSPVTLRPCRFSLFRYCLFPLAGTAALYPLSQAARALLPAWGELIGHLTFMILLPCLWLLILRITDRYTAGLSHRDGIITLRYSKGFTLHTVLIPQDKLVAVRYRQSPFQRRGDRCTLLIYTYNEAREPHRLLRMPLAGATRVLDDLLCENKG